MAFVTFNIVIIMIRSLSLPLRIIHFTSENAKPLLVMFNSDFQKKNNRKTGRVLSELTRLVRDDESNRDPENVSEKGNRKPNRAVIRF